MAPSFQAGDLRWYSPTKAYDFDSLLNIYVPHDVQGVSDEAGLAIIGRAIEAWNGASAVKFVHATEAQIDSDSLPPFANDTGFAFTYDDTGADLVAFDTFTDSTGHIQYNIRLSESADLSDPDVAQAMEYAVAQIVGDWLGVDPIPGSPVLESQLVELQDRYGTVMSFGKFELADVTDLGAETGVLTVMTDDGEAVYTGNSLEFLEGTLEYSATSDATMIQRMYKLAMGRDSDVQGMSFWLEQAEAQGLAHVATALLDSAEAQAREAWLTTGDSATFLEQLYTHVLDRASDEEGLSFWEQAMADGADRGEVLTSFLNGGEYQATAKGEFVFLADYEKMGMVRAMDALQLWDDITFKTASATLAANQQEGGSQYQLVSALYAHAEGSLNYDALDDADFIETMYQSVLHRAADDDGVAYWQGQLDADVSRGQVMTEFLYSQEAVNAQAAVMNEASWTIIT